MNRKNIVFGVMTTVLVMVILLSTSQTVMSKEKADLRSIKQYYAVKEQEYVSEIKAVLSEMGYSNSGVTLRRVSDEEGNRIYTIMIHHQRIDSLSVEEKEKLKKQLGMAEFEDAACCFIYEFITA